MFGCPSPFDLSFQNGLCSSEEKDFVETAGNLSLLFMARTRKGREMVGEETEEREREVKKGFPSSYGIYLSASPSGTFGRGPTSDSLCELSQRRLVILVSH